MSALQRITTEYIETEDRIRIKGQLASGETLILWMTQRLLARLLPHLYTWLNKNTPNSDLVDRNHLTEKKTSKQNFPIEEPVVVTHESKEMLIFSVEVNSNFESLQMRMSTEHNFSTTISVNPTDLLKWLTILHNIWKAAEWDRSQLVEWTIENTRTSHFLSTTKIH